MKITGIIAEYNPLHNGHMHHMEEIKKGKPDLIIAVMSGTLTSRGDLSLFDKFEKTRQALKAGCDIVVELPAVLAMERADLFADNTVGILNELKVNEIVIGSEENSLSLYKDKYESQQMDQNDVTHSMKDNAKGLSDLSSNDTLGFFYYKTIRDNNYPILLKTIKRLNSGFLDEALPEGFIASATAIRHNLDKMDSYVPDFVKGKNREILDEERMFSYLKYKILSSGPKELKEIFFVDEGLENKLKDIKDYSDFDSFVTYLSGKKYTKSRMKRMLMYVLFNIKKEDVNSISDLPLRVLGYTEKGKNYLHTLKKEKEFHTNIKEGMSPLFDAELKISKIMDMIYGRDIMKKEQAGPVLLKEDE